MTEDPTPDAELVRRVLDGDLEAFDEIDRRYREPLCRFLHRYTLGRELAEELCQRTLIRAYEMLRQLQSPEKLAGWLHRIASRMAAAEGRRRKSVSLDAAAIYDVATPSEPAKIEKEEESKDLWRTAEQELSAEEFLVLSLRYRDELPLPEIAKKLKKKEGTVRVQLHRARRKLLPLFQDFVEK